MNGSGNGLFVSMLTGLTPNTTYNVRAYAINTAGVGYGNDIAFTTPAVVIIPQIFTKLASGVTQTTIITGGININVPASVDYYAMQYRIGTSGTWLLSPTLPLSGPLAVNNFNTTINGLTSSITGGTTYQYRAYMVVSGSPYYGLPKQITTLTIPTFVPTITTNDISSIAITTATGGGNVTSDGGVSVTARGTAWSLVSNPTIADSHTTDGTGTGTYSSSLTGLLANTTYFVRAYAINSVGTAYGNQVTFTTLPLPNISLPIIRTSHNGTGPGQQSNGSIYPNPPLGAGQCVTANFNIIHNVFACNQTGGQNLTTIYCCVGGVWQIVSPSPFVTGAPAIGPPARCVGSYSLSVTIHQNERLCYVNQVASNSCCACCTSSLLYILNASSSPNITVTPMLVDCLCV
jgi:hypothetical protein